MFGTGQIVLVPFGRPKPWPIAAASAGTFSDLFFPCRLPSTYIYRCLTVFPKNADLMVHLACPARRWQVLGLRDKAGAEDRMQALCI